MRKAKTGRRAAAQTRPGARAPRRPASPTLTTVEAALASLAHDIRTPLTGILALSELLIASELDERERQWASAIKSTAEHIGALASLIVDAAKADAGKLALATEVFDLRRLVEDIRISLSARAATKGLESSASVAADAPTTMIGDPARLRAALENLIDNAVKFTDQGRVTLAVASEPASRGRLRLAFAITDSGIGLSTAEIKRLFRPFSQANDDIARRYGGAGLGLLLVKRLAKAMGGDLTVTSAPGDGSTFRLTLVVDPAQAESTVNANPAARPITAAPRGLNILCVEDNPYGRVVLNAILSGLGHRAAFAASGEAALAAAQKGGQDLILLDVTLPGIDGLETARRIRALNGGRRRLPIIGLSGKTDAVDAEAGRAAGMDAYLTKPLSPHALAEVISNLVTN